MDSSASRGGLFEKMGLWMVKKTLFVKRAESGN